MCSVPLQARRWSCWNGRANGPGGVWSGPPSAAHLRRDWFPALHSACPTLAPAWRWTASSAGKVGRSSESDLLLCSSLLTNNDGSSKTLHTFTHFLRLMTVLTEEHLVEPLTVGTANGGGPDGGCFYCLDMSYVSFSLFSFVLHCESVGVVKSGYMS